MTYKPLPEPREKPSNTRAAPPQPKPLTEREPTVLPAHIRITQLPLGYARNSNIWRIKGGMSGGATGACKGVTSCPIVARAHIGRKG